MRLLQLCDGELSLTRDLICDIPPYAILSHTWGPDNEEVTFQDISQKRGYTKLGYQKILFCGQQAKHNGLDYFWVDTCCIDKTSSAELAEAITSMFQWYHDAAVCYVYLTDVSTGSIEQPGSWERQFERSRWFTRGWTLQELIAPPLVEFFTKEGEKLGDKTALKQQIHEITGIALPALQGTRLSDFDVEERFKWANTRETTKKEDWAYCLLGIFGVFMGPLYGEGKENAVRRLKREIAEVHGSNHQGVPSGVVTVQSSEHRHDHYYTLDKNDNVATGEGYKCECIEGYVCDKPGDNTIAVYQYRHKKLRDHFLTITKREGDGQWDMEYEKVAFYTFKHEERPSFLPLSKFLPRISNLYTTDAEPKFLPLRRFLTPWISHLYTTDAEEQRQIQQEGFKSEGDIGFVSCNLIPETVPLYRWYKH
ncbi:hypothetical protein G7054_g11871 [Neopestalotiopsis clavispora]|nr:hypothetical protein G7054_g11871 [Neopestalotiopsis clavispora]